MSTFEDHLWTQLVTDHGDQIRQAGEATAALAASSAETGERDRWPGSRRQPSRRPVALAATTLGAIGVVSALIVVLIPTSRPTSPTVSPASFTVADNHDGTVTATLHRRSALPALNVNLARYGLKAKLPGDVTARTLSLTATCPKVPTLPGNGHPAAVAVSGTINPKRLKNCKLHTT